LSDEESRSLEVERRLDEEEAQFREVGGRSDERNRDRTKRNDGRMKRNRHSTKGSSRPGTLERGPGTPLVTSAGVVAQVWRGGARAQVPVAFLLRRTSANRRASSVITRSLRSSAMNGQAWRTTPRVPSRGTCAARRPRQSAVDGVRAPNVGATRTHALVEGLPRAFELDIRITQT